MSLCRDVIAALLPPGTLWIPEDNAELDLLLDGMAENHEGVRAALENLARVRSPLHTDVLDDLEKEYGILPNSVLDESVRRSRLAAIKAARSSNGTLDDMQTALQGAGFDLYVHTNDPAVDPAGFAGAQLIVNNGVSNEFTIPAAAGYWPLFFFVGGPATRDESGAITDIDAAVVPSARMDELVRLITRYKPMHTWGLLVA